MPKKKMKKHKWRSTNHKYPSTADKKRNALVMDAISNVSPFVIRASPLFWALIACEDD